MAIFGNVCKTHTVRHQTVHKSHYSAPNRVDCEFSSHRLMLIRFEKAGKGLDVDFCCCVASFLFLFRTFSNRTSADKRTECTEAIPNCTEATLLRHQNCTEATLLRHQNCTENTEAVHHLESIAWLQAVAPRLLVWESWERVFWCNFLCVVSSRSLAFSNLLNVAPVRNLYKNCKKLYKTVQKSPLSIPKLYQNHHWLYIFKPSPHAYWVWESWGGLWM